VHALNSHQSAFSRAVTLFLVALLLLAASASASACDCAHAHTHTLSLSLPKPQELCLRLRWDSLGTVSGGGVAGVPLLLLSSTRDEIVPAAQMAQLRDAAKGAAGNGTKVHFHSFDATHNDIWAAGGALYWAAKRAFLQEHCSM